jgi:hypothetical protein
MLARVKASYTMYVRQLAVADFGPKNLALVEFGPPAQV